MLVACEDSQGTEVPLDRRRPPRFFFLYASGNGPPRFGGDTIYDVAVMHTISKPRILCPGVSGGLRTPRIAQWMSVLSPLTANVGLCLEGGEAGVTRPGCPGYVVSQTGWYSVSALDTLSHRGRGTRGREVSHSVWTGLSWGACTPRGLHGGCSEG